MWRHFFTVTLQNKSEKRQELSMPMGCADI